MWSPAILKLTVRFPNDTQVRYVERIPSRGERIRGLHGELFVVLRTDTDEAGTIATCATPLAYARDTRRAGRVVKEAARERRRGAAERGERARRLLGKARRLASKHRVLRKRPRVAAPD